MKILVVAATKAEVNLFYQHFNLPADNLISGKLFDVLITGVGMVATAFALGKALSQKQYHLVINVGIAGCFDQKIELGTVLHITEDTFAELGAENHDDFLPITDLGFGENKYSSSFSPSTSLVQVKGITVNRVSGNQKTIDSLIERFNPCTESMEGAAVFYACQQEKINCLQVRSVSNYVEPRNKENWQIGLAIKNLNAWLIHFIEQQQTL
ncbi:futalosine hydrolase [Pedobacter sp. MW01-1-1]|uniref:futalosine hydrolase n=1 Tax=Pedobacter sp. MW01-1-1 TaxID=3383027 RepID=UPI003FEF5A21